MNICPKISVVIPSYNQGKFLEQCILSILNQDYENTEIIIIDGKSSDESVEIIKKYQDKITYWQSQHDNGQADAINQGVARCTGDIVTWLNSDDYYLPEIFDTIISCYQQYPEAPFYFGDGLKVDEKGIAKSKFFNETILTCFNRKGLILGLNYILQPATFINAKHIDKNDFLDKNLHYGLDTDLWIRLSDNKTPICIPKCLAASREYSSTKTSSGSFKRIEELRRIAEKHSDVPFAPGTLCYFLDTLHSTINQFPELYSADYKSKFLEFWSETAKLLRNFGESNSGMPITEGKKSFNIAFEFSDIINEEDQAAFFWTKLLKLFSENYPEHNYFIFFQAGDISYLDDNYTNVTCFYLEKDNFSDELSEVLKSRKVDVLIHRSPNKNITGFPDYRKIVFINEFEHESFPDRFYKTLLRENRLDYNHALSCAAGILTSSDTVKQSLLKYPWTKCKNIVVLDSQINNSLLTILDLIDAIDKQAICIEANKNKIISETNWQPLVSIITPSFNQGRFIQRTIDSVLDQTYKNIEYIVIDGNSTDNTKEILESYGNKFYWISEPDNGQTHAINKGFARAKGEVLTYLNSDDVLLPNSIQMVVDHFKANPDVDMVYGDADYVDENDGFIRTYQTAAYSFSRLMEDCCVCQPAAFWRKRIAEIVGPFNEKLNYAMDYDYWLRIDRSGGKIAYYPEKLAWSRLYPETKTMSARGKIYNEIFIVCKENGGYVSLHYYQALWHYYLHEKKLTSKIFQDSLLFERIAKLHRRIDNRHPHWIKLRCIKLFNKIMRPFLPIFNLLRIFKSSIKQKTKLILKLNSKLILPINQKGIPLRIPKNYYKAKKLLKYPTISIVTPSYNQANFIEKTIRSVLEQNYPNLEYIIQDGHSSDGTIETLKKHESQLKNWESKKDTGQSNAINLGFQHATGDIMAYLNSDDLLLPGSLNYIADYFEKHPDVDVVYGYRILIDENDLEIGRWVLPPHSNSVTEWADYVPQETMFWRKRVWDKVGGKIDDSFRFAMDWDLIIRFQQAGAKIKRLPRFLGAFRIHQAQKTSAQMSDIGVQEMRRIRKFIHKREVCDTEIGSQIKNYILKHIFFHKLNVLKMLFSKKSSSVNNITIGTAPIETHLFIERN